MVWPTSYRSLPLTAADAMAALRAGELSSEELTRTVLERADKFDEAIGSYVTRFDDYAIERARAADREHAEGIWRGPMHGIPIGVKDIMAMAEGPTTANSLVLDPAWGAGRDAPVVTRLKAAGAVITGKLVTSEFAIGSPDPSKPFPVPRNPWDTARSTGGSSAGSANGIASGFFLAALGSDTAGSIRLPASWVGVTGLMPTYGRVPKSGCVPLAYSLDRVGPMARSALDCANLLGVIAGHHPSDHSCSEWPSEHFDEGLTEDLPAVRIGVDRSDRFFPADCDPRLRAAFESAVDVMVELGAEAIDVELPLFEEASAAVWVMMPAEAFAYHRNDLQRRWDDYYPVARQTIARGALCSGADYVQAARVRHLAQRRIARLFDDVDVVLTPTTATAAPTREEWIGRRREDPSKTVFTYYWNAVGNPALAFPIGFNANQLPLSAQAGAAIGAERTALRVVHAYQQVTRWHLQVPAVHGDAV